PISVGARRPARIGRRWAFMIANRPSAWMLARSRAISCSPPARTTRVAAPAFRPATSTFRCAIAASMSATSASSTTARSSGMTSEVDVYGRQGFGQDLEVRHPLALVVVDFVNGFVDPEQFGGGNIPAAVEATIPLLAAFRERGLPVAFSRIVFADDGADANIFSRKVPTLLRLTEATPSSAVVDALCPGAGELVVRKTEPSAFSGTGVAAWLRSHGVASIVVVGATTRGCVRASVVDAMSSGFIP